MPSAVWPSAGCSSSSARRARSAPARAAPGPGARAPAARALDVVLLVEVAQLALRRAGLGAQPRGGRLGHAERRVREGVAAEQVVPVAVGRQQPADGEAACAAIAGSSSSSSGKTGESISERLARPPRTSVQVVW